MMRFFAFEKDGETRLGVEREGVQHDITRGAVRDFGKRLISEFLQADELDALIGSIDDQTLLLEEMPDQFTWLPPIPRPGKILAMVQNYRKHAAEFGHQLLDAIEALAGLRFGDAIQAGRQFSEQVGDRVVLVAVLLVVFGAGQIPQRLQPANPVGFQRLILGAVEERRFQMRHQTVV